MKTDLRFDFSLLRLKFQSNYFTYQRTLSPSKRQKNLLYVNYERYLKQQRQAMKEYQDYIKIDHKSESDFSSFGGANCLVSWDRVHGSRGALCGG